MPTIPLPWGAWYGDGRHQLELPDGWPVQILAPADSPEATIDEIQAVLRSPVQSPPLVELARGRKRACVVVDDLARPTRLAGILPLVLDELHAGGLARDAVTVLVATGTHGQPPRELLAEKLGPDTLARYQVECHDARDGLVATDIQYGARPLRINRTFYEAELRIAVGSVLPHSFAGYSGGAKLVLPGLSDVDAAARSHKFVQLGLRGGSDPNDNGFRREAESLVRQIGLDFAICAVVNARRDTAALVAGDFVAAHRQACQIAWRIYRTQVQHQYDCLILNAYPKDIDLIQAENALVALKRLTTPVVRDGGVIVLASAASQGLGRHGLFEPGGAGYRRPTRKRALGRRELWIYAPSLSTEAVRKLFWEGYPAFHDSGHLRQALAERFDDTARAAVLPCAPMTQLVDW